MSIRFSRSAADESDKMMHSHSSFLVVLDSPMSVWFASEEKVLFEDTLKQKPDNSLSAAIIAPQNR